MIRTLLLLLLLFVVAAGAFAFWSYTRFDGEISGDVARLKANSAPQGKIVTEAMLAPLPEPARRYLRRAGIVGKPIPAIVHLRQSGRIRSAADAGWMTFDAEQIYATRPPSFVWRAFMPSRALPVVIGRDEYLDHKGSILMKAGGFLPMADESGDQLIAAGLMRFLNEMMWFPARYLLDDVTIASDGDNSFSVTLNDGDLSASAIIFVDSEGLMTNFRAQRFDTGTRQMLTWETPISHYGVFEGLTLATAGSALWKRPDGDFTYIELTITGLEYDPQ